MGKTTLFEVDVQKVRKPRPEGEIMMHVSDGGEMPDGTQAVRFECGQCSHETDWIKERKPYGVADQKGRPCPNCNRFGPMKMSASISPCQKYRWTLTRTWGEGAMICWIMQNPSKADHRVNDPTILRVIHFTKLWGYDGFTVVNKFPFRSSSPRECRDHFAGSWEGPDWDIRDIRDQGGRLVVNMAKCSSLVVAAWGNSCSDNAHSWGEYLIEQIQEGPTPYPQVWCLGTTQDGSPKHPLARGVHRVPNDQQPVLWKQG